MSDAGASNVPTGPTTHRGKPGGGRGIFGRIRGNFGTVASQPASKVVKPAPPARSGRGRSGMTAAAFAAEGAGPEHKDLNTAPSVKPVPTKAPTPRRGGGMMQAASSDYQETGDLFADPKETRKTLPADDSVEIHAKVKHVIFRAKDSGFTVLEVSIKGEKKTCKLVVTTATEVSTGAEVEARGKWGSRRGEEQFAADFIKLTIAPNARGIVAWLRRGAVQGVGPAAIAKLSALGTELPLLMEDPEKLASASGIKAVQATAISHAYCANSKQGEILTELYRLGLRPKQAAKVIERYGASCLKLIRTNPWELTEMEGIGFPSADMAGMEFGLDKRTPARLKAGLVHVLNESINANGHCGVPRDELVKEAAIFLNVDQEDVEKQMEAFIDNVKVVEDHEIKLIYPMVLWRAERQLVDDLMRLLNNPDTSLSQEEADKAICRAEAETNFTLDREGGQYAAAMMALTNPVSIITGGPGTGKSTVQKVIVKALSYSGKTIALAAPTGKAAKRLSETSEREALTVHRQLSYSPMLGDFTFNEDNPLKLNCAIDDEVSMMDLLLMSSQARALPDGASFLMVGDFHQLASVGAGQVLNDLIGSGVIPVSTLTKIRRTQEGSGIAVAAKRINEGMTPIDPDHDMRGFRVIEARDVEINKLVVDLVRFELPEMGFDPLKDIQVLSCMRKGEIGSVPHLNLALKDALNPATEGEDSVKIGDRWFSVNDRIMHLRNDYIKGVCNGETGHVVAAGRQKEGDNWVSYITVDYDGTQARYTSEDIFDVEHAFAGTVHKSQGGEYPVVIMVVPYSHRRMLNRNLLYTGITRSKVECIVIGSKNLINSAVDIEAGTTRYTGLKQRLLAATGRPVDSGVMTADEFELTESACPFSHISDLELL